MRKLGIKKHVELSDNLWMRFMAFKVDFLLFDDDRALDFAVDVRLLLNKHDTTGLIGKLFTGAIDNDDWKKIEWWRKHKAYEDMCEVRVALHTGEYAIQCLGANRYKCKKCPVY